MASHPAQPKPAPNPRGPVMLEDWITEMVESGYLSKVTTPEPDPVLEAHRVTADVDAQQRARIGYLVKTLGVPDRHARRKLYGVIEPSRAGEFVKRWRSSDSVGFGSILVLSGSRGCGKTQAIAGAVMDGPPRRYPYGVEWPASRRPYFITARNLQRKGLFDDELERMEKASVLAIDDLGTEYNDEKGAFKSLLDGLLDRRYAGPGWTLISSNLLLRGDPKARDRADREGFAERYGERLISRLEEPGCYFAWLKEPSFRTAHAATAAKEKGTP